MRTATFLALSAFAFATASAALAKDSTPISGQYLEVRSCDVYTGPCFANGEMNLAGKEGILVWSVREGSWQGTALDGLKVIAVVRTDDTLGDLQYHPRDGRAVLIVDARATRAQQEALASFARSMAGGLLRDVVEVKALAIKADLGSCAQSGCAQVTAGDLVEISTRCLGNKDHVCGNEEAYYPPLIAVTQAQPAYTEMAAFRGNGLGVTWEATGQRSAFLGAFSR